MSDDIKMTRSEELRLKERIELASSGHDILEKKRDGLIHEFMEIVDEARDVNDDLAQSFIDAKKERDRAKVYDGEDELKAAALEVTGSPVVSSETRNIMGVLVPQISSDSPLRRNVLERDYGVTSTSSRIDGVAEQYEELLENVVKAAEVQTKVLKLLQEIEKTKRRVNALEHKVIPEMESALDKVSQGLEEREREETFRMKKVKEMQE